MNMTVKIIINNHLQRRVALVILNVDHTNTRVIGALETWIKEQGGNYEYFSEAIHGGVSFCASEHLNIAPSEKEYIFGSIKTVDSSLTQAIKAVLLAA